MVTKSNVKTKSKTTVKRKTKPKAAPMNKGLQIHKIRRYLDSIGLSSDLVDVPSLIDSTLTYSENRHNIVKKIRKGYKKIQDVNKLSGQSLNFEMDQAEAFFGQRSQRSQDMDSRKRARKTFTEKDIIKNPDVLNKWYKKPNRYDIVGID